jgi:hypothetical protein
MVIRSSGFGMDSSGTPECHRAWVEEAGVGQASDALRIGGRVAPAATGQATAMDSPSAPFTPVM